MSIFGVIALTGVVVHDSLVMVSFVNHSVREGESRIDAIMNAGQKRFRAIILTTLTTFIGVLPMIFETSMQAANMIPMAISLGFGVLFATTVTLILIPCLYMALHDIQDALGNYFFEKVSD
jgi:multidrug efflux pump subunit AcrB